MQAWNARWISYVFDPRQDCGVFAFRTRLELDEVPASLVVRVSADQRYKLFVNGALVEFGPQRGDALHWFYETVNLAPHLKVGTNWVSALVWNFGFMAPMAQCTVRTGFILDSDIEALRTPGEWQVAKLDKWGFDMMYANKANYYIDIGPGELIDFRGAPWGWRTGEEPEGTIEWREPHRVYHGESRGANSGGTPWNLIPRSIPSMLYLHRDSAPVIRHDFRSEAGAREPLNGPLRLQPNEPVLLDFQELLCAYPRFRLSGPPGTVVKVTYEEAMWKHPDAKGTRTDPDSGKGHRDEVLGSYAKGYQDRFILDGTTREIEPLWWRTFRFVMIEVESETRDERQETRVDGALREGPLSPPPTPSSSSGTNHPSDEEGASGAAGAVLESIAVYETGYPLPEESSFEADDPWVKPLWDVSMRTAKRCAGETYFDCPYYEQLQYVGDTRIQALIGYYLGRDRALQRNAVETLGWSLMENGLTHSRYPSRQPQVIPPFSLWWVMMLYDQMLYDTERPDFASFQTVNRILGRYRKLQKTDAQFWQFGDWVPEWRGGVPPKGANSLVHRLTLQWAQYASLALKQHWEGKAHKPVEREFWRDYSKFGYADLVSGPDVTAEDACEHAEALFRLISAEEGDNGPAWPGEALEKASAARCTYYFSYYKHLAMFAREDNPFDYVTELAPWKEMIENGLTTFAENPEPVRSDCHAWSAHPILGFFQIVAGVTSTAPGWSKAKIDPRPGSIRRFDARIAHPQGDLRVKLENGRLEVDTPVPAEVRWQGKSAELEPGRHLL